MRFVVPKTGQLRDLLAEAGVQDPQSAAQLIAERNGIQEEATQGAVLELPDALVRSMSTSQLSALTTSEKVEGATTMGSLGMSAIATLLDSASGDGVPSLGRLAALAAIEFPELSMQSIEGGRFELEVPLRAGRCQLPLEDGKRLALEVPKGTVFSASLELAPGAEGPQLKGGQIRFSQPVKIVNQADMSLLAKLPMGGIAATVANGVLGVSLRGVDIQEGGRTSMMVRVDRPSLNPLKALTGQRSNADFTVPDEMLPKMKTSVLELLQGNLTKQRSALAPGVPQSFELGAMLQAMGGVTQKGRFSFSLRGKQGVVDVSESGLQVRGHNSPVVARISGDFDIDEKGEITTSFEGRSNTERVDARFSGTGQFTHRDGVLEGKLSTEGRAVAPMKLDTPIRVLLSDRKAGAKVGKVEVSHDEKQMQVRSGRRWFGIADSIERRLLMSMGDRVSLETKGASMFSGDFSFSLGAEGLQLQSPQMNVAFDLEDAALTAEGLDVRLGEGSSFSMELSDVQYDDQGLRLYDLEGGMEVRIAQGKLSAGALGASFDAEHPATLRGKIALDNDALDTSVDFSVFSVPKLLGVNVGMGMGVKTEGQLRARITKEGLEISPSDRSISLYR